MTINKWSKTKWLIYGCIFIIILFLIFGIAWRIRNNNRPPDAPDQYNNPSIWSNPNPDDRIGPETSNVCFLYKFTSIAKNIGTNAEPNYIILPGQPTLNSEVLDNITEDELKQIPPDDLRCVDTDQILARRGFQQCYQRVNSNIKAVNICTKNDGTKALPGEKQYLYYNDGGVNQGLGACPNVRACNGQVSLVSIDYNPDKNRNYAIGCITKDTNNNVSLKNCAYPDYPDYPESLNNQLFRVTRMNYGENPYPSDTDQSTGKLSSQNGIFAQILERDNNTCLRLSEDNNTIQFGTCLGGYSDDNKIGGPYEGFNWIALPTISVDYGGTSSNYGQQLIYIGNINMYDFKDIYTGITGFYGYTGTAAWMGYLISNNARSLRSFQCCGNKDPNYNSVNCNLALGPIVPQTFPDYYDSKSYTAQYFNISNFNLLKKVPGCAYSGANANIVNCLGL